MPSIKPDQFLASIAKRPLAPVYLFLGPEGYYRRVCRSALVARVLPPESRTEGFTGVDLEDTSLESVLDDARSLSLFSSDRVIWVSSAELALPRRMTTTNDAEEASERPDQPALTRYLQAPTPGTVIVFECSRYDFNSEDRPKLERVQKFYSDIPVTVEFRSLSSESSRYLAQELAKQHGLQLGGAELAILLETVAGDANRLASEIEKLALFVGSDKKVGMDDIHALVPDAAQSTIFTLVNALGNRDRAEALESLNILVREGEYLPLALAFLSTQFRLALAVREARVKTVQQAQALFAKLGARMWRERAEQILRTASAFTNEALSGAVALIYETDKAFREGYRDDALIMERLVIALTAAHAANR